MLEKEMQKMDNKKLMQLAARALNILYCREYSHVQNIERQAAIAAREYHNDPTELSERKMDEAYYGMLDAQNAFNRKWFNWRFIWADLFYQATGYYFCPEQKLYDDADDPLNYWIRIK